MSGTLIIILLIQMFLLGALLPFLVRYGVAHFGSAKHPPEVPHPSSEPLSPAIRQRLLHESQSKFESAINHAVAQLHDELEDSAVQANEMVKHLAAEIVAGEMERYRVELGRLREDAGKQMGAISQEVSKYETDLKAKMAAELEAEKQRLIKQIDTKLADAVGSFLTETLGHNVDLGEQSAYLISILEEHKADFIKEVGPNEAAAAR
jgi:F0F1-type ATP synthase membrane subunit b/b'